MKRGSAVVFLSLLVVVLASCVPVISLQPWYMEKDVIYEPELEGSWSALDDQGKPDVGTTLTIARDGGNGYNFSYTEKEAPNVKITYSLHVFRVGEREFVDSVGGDSFYKDHRLDDQMKLGVHMAGKIKVEKDAVHIQMLDDEWLDKEIEAKRVLIRNESSGSTHLLTASTAELRELLTKNAADEKAFAVKIELKRR
ncbi:MAG: hypothetical protein ACRD50_03150 [Candidatus Acidiferrales bacterium]